MAATLVFPPVLKPKNVNLQSQQENTLTLHDERAVYFLYNPEDSRYNKQFQNPLTFSEYEKVKERFLYALRKLEWNRLDRNGKRDALLNRIIDSVGSDPEKFEKFLEKARKEKPELYWKMIERSLPNEATAQQNDKEKGGFAPIIINTINTPSSSPAIEPPETKVIEGKVNFPPIINTDK